MNITIQDIIAIHSAGQRSNNEDHLFPEDHLITPVDRMFMVCDGVGENRGGEIASQLVCKHFSNYLLRLGDVFQSKEVLAEALCYTEQTLDEYVRSYPEYQGMATTLAYLNLTSYGAVIAWVGDSRVIQVREGRVIRQTKDHSLVNALLDYGEIKADELIDHPKKNVILRAVSGTDIPAKLDVMYIDDLMPGDFFMICTDGIVEGVGDQLEELFSRSFSMEQLRYDIDSLCRKNTLDNYSMILLCVGQVAGMQPKPGLMGKRPSTHSSMEGTPVSARVDGPIPDRTRRLPRAVFFIPVFILLLSWWWFTLPPGLQATLIAQNGVLIRGENHKVLIDAFPLSDKVREHAKLSSLRQEMILGNKPFDQVELFLVSYPPNVENDTAQRFLETYLQRNPDVELHPKVFREQLRNGHLLFQPFTWDTNEWNEEMEVWITQLPKAIETGNEMRTDFSAFLLRMEEKTLLYAGDPAVDIDYLMAIPEYIDYVLINEWNLRTSPARRTLLSRFDDRSIIVLPSNRPMNNRQREDILLSLPKARFLGTEQEKVRLR